MDLTFYKTIELRNGWTEYVQYRHVLNEDGTISKRSNAVKTGVSHQTNHRTNQVREYKDNLEVAA